LPSAAIAVTPEIRRYIAFEAVRRYGPLEPDLPQRLRRYIRRNTGVFVDRDVIASVLQLYKQVYGTAQKLLPRFRNASTGRYAEYEDIRVGEFLDALAAHYPDEPREQLQSAMDMCIYYDYLR
jgi:hypothetical protein